LKPERWGSPLVQEKYQEEKACDKRHPYNNNNNNNNNKYNVPVAAERRPQKQHKITKSQTEYHTTITLQIYNRHDRECA
jgi:hypothetical protein